MFTPYELELLGLDFCTKDQVRDVQALQKVLKQNNCDLLKTIALQKQVDILEGKSHED